jgi:hypothetical protein
MLKDLHQLEAQAGVVSHQFFGGVMVRQLLKTTY